MSWKSSVLALASQRMPRMSSRVLASAGYTREPSDLGPPDSFTEWTAATALRQDRAWQPIVDEVKAGNPRGDVEALFEALDGLHMSGASLLEVGCGGGYYSEIIAHRFPDISYQGIDLSAPSIALAREHYPEREFVVGSAYDLPFGDRSVDIVMDGVALIHMPQWRRAVTEYARVARRAVIFHGLTVTDEHSTIMFAKYAYGQPSLESAFNRADLEAECAAAGLGSPRVIAGLEYDLEKFIGVPSAEETWVFPLG